MDKYVPFVINKLLEKTKFNPDLIYKSLLKETLISEKNAKKVTEQVTRIIIAAGKVKIVTAPMIREITNTVLLQHGLEVERLQYTRIGFPMFDLVKLLNSTTNHNYIDNEIVTHVKKEYYAVLDIIKQLQEK